MSADVIFADMVPVSEAIVEHYAVAGPILERLFGGIPFVWLTVPQSMRGARVFHGPLSQRTRTKDAVVEAPLASGVRRYPQLSASRIEGLVAKARAVEVYSRKAGRSLPGTDSQIAAIGAANDLAVVTRNVRHFDVEPFHDLRVVNPWT